MLDKIDLFAIKDESWAFELKWKGKRVGPKRLETFVGKIEADRYVVFSAVVFTPEAERFAQRHGIYLWSREELGRYCSGCVRSGPRSKRLRG